MYVNSGDTSDDDSGVTTDFAKTDINISFTDGSSNDFTSVSSTTFHGSKTYLNKLFFFT